MIAKNWLAFKFFELYILSGSWWPKSCSIEIFALYALDVHVDATRGNSVDGFLRVFFYVFGVNVACVNGRPPVPGKKFPLIVRVWNEKWLML